jgi:hypothetical protein
MADHVHIMKAIPPKCSVSNVVDTLMVKVSNTWRESIEAYKVTINYKK